MAWMIGRVVLGSSEATREIKPSRRRKIGAGFCFLV